MNGQISIPNIYDDVTTFGSLGLAVVLQEGNPSIIDHKGNIVPGGKKLTPQSISKQQKLAMWYCLLLVLSL